MNKLMPVLLVLALGLSPVLSTFAQQLADPGVAKIKTDVARRLRDAKTNVTVRLHSGSELKGRITQAAENMFTLKEKDTGAPRYISYAEVTKVKGGSLSKGTKFGILTGVVAGAFIIGAFVGMKDFEPFKNGVLR